jgi:hypothetical protein
MCSALKVQEIPTKSFIQAMGWTQNKREKGFGFDNVLINYASNWTTKMRGIEGGEN